MAGSRGGTTRLVVRLKMRRVAQNRREEKEGNEGRSVEGQRDLLNLDGGVLGVERQRDVQCKHGGDQAGGETDESPPFTFNCSIFKTLSCVHSTIVKYI